MKQYKVNARFLVLFVCPMHCDSSCVGHTIKLLGPIACRMSGCRVSGSGRGHHSPRPLAR